MASISTFEMPVERHGFPWRLFAVLALVMIVASLLLTPYAVQLMEAGGQVPKQMTRAQVFAAAAFSSAVQAVLIYWPILLVGILTARRLGLGAPYLEALLYRRPLPEGWQRALVTGSLTGLAAGAVLLALVGVFSPLLEQIPELTNLSGSMPNAWQGFLASISAGINEEVLLRLFLLSVLAWLAQAVLLRRRAGRPPLGILWGANVLAAVIFGLAHLPNLAALGVAVTPFLLFYIVLLNGLAGLAFGWLFWTYGLESAILAHFFTDIVLHVLAVLAQNLVR